MKYLFLFFFVTSAFANDVRYCYQIASDIPRDASGSIKRSTTVINAFKKDHPCPSTLLPKGACPDWAIDHVVPLVCGGCDAEFNMQWLPNSIKSTNSPSSKDRWEQRVYCPKKG